MKQFIRKVPILNSFAIWFFRYGKQMLGRYRLSRLTDESSVKIVIGAAGIYDAGWINTEIDFLNLLNPDHWTAYFQRNMIDAILAEHVWEHLTLAEGLEAAKRCFDYLKPGGYLRVAVPDGFHPRKDYIEEVKPGGTGAGAADHKILYNHISLGKVFKEAEFRIVLLEHFDNRGKFHYIDWDPEDGKIHRSKRFDKRNEGGRLIYTSVILDAHKDA